MKPELELKYLTPYLPYRLQVVEVYKDKVISDEFTIDCVNFDGPNIFGSDAPLDSFELGRSFCLEQIKPILRPLSSMTIEEIEELNSLIDDSVRVVVSSGNWVYIEGSSSDPWDSKPTLSLDDINKINEYFFSKHLDVFILIDKGLAIEKTR